MKAVIDFLRLLHEHNNRPWFQANRGLYDDAMLTFNAFVDDLIAGIASFDPSVAHLTAKDCTYRIYRDVRFSPNKMPYKTHFAAYICAGGRKSPYAGYYFHVEPPGFGYLNGHQLVTGLYAPAPPILKSVREDILTNGDAFDASVKKAYDFKTETFERLKRVPLGYPADYKYADYLKMKHPCLVKHVDDAFMLSPNLLSNTLEAFSRTADFAHLLNQSVAFTLE